MAIISGSLLAIGKALSSVASKSKSKKAATKSIKNKQLNNKKPKQKITPQQSVMGERGGALIKTSASAKPKTPKLENTGSKIGYEKINSQINNLVNISSSIDDALKKQYQAELDTRKARKESNQKARRVNREALLEKGKGAAGILAGTIGAVGSKLGIFDFLKNILLGGLLLFLSKNIKKILGALDFLRDNAYLIFLLVRGAVQVFGKSIKLAFNLIKGGVKNVGRLIAGGIKNALKPVGTLFKKAGKGIASGLRRIGNAIFNLAKGGLRRLQDLLGIKPPPGSRKPGSGKTTITGTGAGVGSGSGAGRFSRTDAKGNQVATGGKNYRQQLDRVARPGQTPTGITTPLRPSRTAKFLANLQTGTANVPLPPGAQKGLYRTGSSGLKTVKTTNSFLKNLLGIGGAKDVARLKTASPVLKKASNFMKGVRIPVVGPMIVFTMTALDPDPETGGLGRGAFKAIGAGLGEFLGFGIPIPVLGPIIGGLIGEVMGDAAYELIINKDPKAAGAKIMNAVGAVAEVGGKILDWMKGVVEGFWESLPKAKMPDWLPFGLGGQEILDPKMFTGPLGLLGAFGIMGKAMVSAIFNPNKEEKGKVDDKSKLDNVKPYFKAAGGYYSNETRGYLGATEEEARKKLGLEVKTTAPQTSLVNGVLKPPSVGESEQDLFRRLVYAEAGGEGIMGMALVARSVLNRAGLIQSGKASTGTFLAKDKTITGVIMGRNQYQPVSDGSINRKRSQAQLDDAQKAIDIALNTADLRGRLEAEGMDANSINKLVASTGFRTGSAFNDPSQNVNVTKYKNHFFNTAGNPGLSVETAKVSTDQLRLKESSVNPTQLTEEGMSSEQPQTGSEMQKSPSQSSSSQSSGSPISSSQGQKSTGNLEKFAGYEDGTDEEIIVPMQDQGPIPIPVPSGGGSSAGSFSSSSGLLNSYYKKQLLGLLYKVG